MRPAPFFVVAALVLAIGLAGCGGEDTAVTASATPGASTAVPSSPTPQAATPEATLQPSTPTPEMSAFNDPFQYCAAVGTIDAPDNRYTGPPVPDAVKEGLQALGHWTSEAATVWRCMDGKVLACNGGANLPCGQANTSTEPSPDMGQWCTENPDSPIPAAVTGHSTTYIWECQGGEPRIVKQVINVDSRGFGADFWFEIVP